MDDTPRISLLISQAMTLYRIHLNALLAQNGIDLTSEMCAVLGVLWKSDGRKQQELADILCKDKGGITKIIDNLEKRKLVIRHPDNIDGRNKIVTLTKDGLALKKTVVPLANGLLNKVTSSIDKQKLQIASQVLTDIIKELK